jgi:exosortase
MSFENDENISKGGYVLQLTLLAFALFFAFIDVFQNLWKAWVASDDYSHCFFILPIALYVSWRKKERLSALPVKPSAFGGLCLIFLLLLYIFARHAEITTLSSVIMVLVLFCLVFFLAGLVYLKELIFPLMLLFFMIPVPEQIYSFLTVPLQLFVSYVSVSIVQLFDIPIYREGNVIHLPARTLEVVQACSGLRSLMSLVTLSLLMGYFFLQSHILRVIMLAVSLPVAILVNCLRVLVTLVVLYSFQYDLTDHSVHSLYGLVVFMVALLLLFSIRTGLERWDH